MGTRTRLGFLVLAAAFALVGVVRPVPAAEPVSGQAPDVQRLTLVRPAATPGDDRDRTRIEIDPPGYARLWDGARAIVEEFPLPDGRRVALDLRPFSFLAPDALVVSVDERGPHRRPRPALRFFRGRVEGDADSLVVLGLFQNRVAGFLRTASGEFAFGPASWSLSAPDAMQVHVWERAEERGGWSCAGGEAVLLPGASPLDELSTELSAAPRASGTSAQGAAQLALPWALDSTTEWCAHFSDDVDAAETFLLNVAAQISALYDAELLVLVEVSFLRTHCGAADPYTDGLTQLADRSTLLDEVRSEWSANMGGVNRAAAHLFTRSDDPSGFAGGLAQTVVCSGPSCEAVLCNDEFGYAVNMLPATQGTPQSFELDVIAHELGHNHSCPHTNCLQTSGGNWLSTCVVESCGVNPWCQATGCFPGPANPAVTGTLMSTGCNARTGTFEDDVVEPILRGAAEAAACVTAAGLPGAVREQTGDGLRVSSVAACPGASLQNDDGSLNQLWGACGGCQYAWIKRFTPSCYPFSLTRVDGLIGNVAPGRPIRIVVYADPAGTGDPANSTLVHTEDVTVQVDSNTVFNQYVLASPVTVTAGDVYFGFYDLVAEDPAPFIARLDTSVNGDSYDAINTTAPGGFSFKSEGTWMIRGAGGSVPAGSVQLTWGLPCNDATTPGQDFAVYRGDIGAFGVYSNLTCSTGSVGSFLAEGAADDSFFLVVPQSTTSEGSYGRDSTGAERAAAAVCKPQDLEACP